MTDTTPAACLDCGLPYEDFGLDLLLPRPQWLEIHPSEGGLLCARCIIRRAAKIPCATAVHAVIEVFPNEKRLLAALATLEQDLRERRFTGDREYRYRDMEALTRGIADQIAALRAAHRTGDIESPRSLQPHLHDVDRTATCWCGAKPGQPHVVNEGRSLSPDDVE